MSAVTLSLIGLKTTLTVNDHVIFLTIGACLKLDKLDVYIASLNSERIQVGGTIYNIKYEAA